MNELGPDDLIVPWLEVRYDVGEIQNGWRLTVLQRNPFDAATEVVLYRDDHTLGKSMFLWDLYSPRTGVTVRESSGRVVASRKMQLRLHEDGLRRSDSFELYRNPGSDDRDWGRLRVTVDDQVRELVVPSSLYRYVHGAAEPYHERRWRPSRQR